MSAFHSWPPRGSGAAAPYGRADRMRDGHGGHVGGCRRASGAVACGIKPDGLEVLDQDWEDAFFVEKCPGCFTAVAAQS
jgi:hypothetical protein